MYIIVSMIFRSKIFTIMDKKAIISGQYAIDLWNQYCVDGPCKLLAIHERIYLEQCKGAAWADGEE